MNLFTRDNIIWTLLFFSSVVVFIVGETNLIPEAARETVSNIAAVAAFVSGKLGWSALPLSDEGKAEARAKSARSDG